MCPNYSRGSEICNVIMLPNHMQMDAGPWSSSAPIRSELDNKIKAKIRGSKKNSSQTHPSDKKSAVEQKKKKNSFLLSILNLLKIYKKNRMKQQIRAKKNIDKNYSEGELLLDKLLDKMKYGYYVGGDC